MLHLLPAKSVTGFRSQQPQSSCLHTMAPKKKEEVKEKPILGRFKSNLKVMRCMVGGRQCPPFQAGGV